MQGEITSVFSSCAGGRRKQWAGQTPSATRLSGRVEPVEGWCRVKASTL